MMTRSYKIADINISVTSLYNDIHEYCGDYRSEESPDIFIEISQADIDFEREKSAREGHEVKNYSDAYLEELAVYRKIAEKMPDFNTFLFHGSAVSVDGLAYMFTAPSGTGKSTHVKLWCELLGNKAVMVNDDKPLIQINSDNAVVYGTPFNGKHRRGHNISVPLKSICILQRSNSNHIHEITASEAYTVLLGQTYRPANSISMEKTIQLLDRLKKFTKFYRLDCNMELEAAQIAYNSMKG